VTWSKWRWAGGGGGAHDPAEIRRDLKPRAPCVSPYPQIARGHVERRARGSTVGPGAGEPGGWGSSGGSGSLAWAPEALGPARGSEGKDRHGGWLNGV
jgi:hypothetical protein